MRERESERERARARERERERERERALRTLLHKDYDFRQLLNLCPC